MPEDRKEQVALFRYSVISEAVSDRLSHPERGLVVRALATKPWVTPEGDERFISRTTIDRWVGAYRRYGLSGLEPEPRSDKGHGRANPELMAEAVRLRRQVPARSAAQIAEIIARAHGVRLAERTLREHLARSGVSRAAISADPARPSGATRPRVATRSGSVTFSSARSCRSRGSPAPSAPSSSCWSTTIPASSWARGGWRRRTPGPARRSCARPSAGGEYQRSAILTTERHIVLISWNGPVRCSGSTSCIPSPTNQLGGESRKGSTAIYVSVS